ncbi:hypothetical protein SapgrDRAFT_0712 [Saprospira grandis DSM 2844]|uniref:CcmD family protein n=1 Tax=Saprospira grandis DSM 2844 TaxID=694433 RepID=J1I198_9BACT|nr:hypothetical protein [Saprospira grandis]EJF52455.1 hypothetical protein SapgrDRAFT_0712 [Saprospira grandis DSM 2844]
MRKTYNSLILMLLATVSLSAQSPSTQTDFLESTGKIYVVVAVILLIFIGIIALLVYLERRLAKIEQAHEDL